MSNIFSLGGSSTQQQPSSVFGTGANNQPKSNTFGAPNTGTSLFGQPASGSSSLFGLTTTSSSAPATSSLFGAPLGTSQPQQQPGGLFGTGGGLFGTIPTTALPSNSFTPQKQQAPATRPFGFGNPATANNQQGVGIFGLGGNTTQQPQSGSVFGQPQNQQQGGSIFGQPQNQQQGGSVFGQPQTQQQGGSIFSQPQNQQQVGSIFGQPQHQQPQQPQQQQQQQPQQQPQQQIGSLLGQSIQPRIWSEQEGQLRKPPLPRSFGLHGTFTNQLQHRPKISNRPDRAHLFQMEPRLSQLTLSYLPLQHHPR